jgi:hypothetical protein
VVLFDGGGRGRTRSDRRGCVYPFMELPFDGEGEEQCGSLSLDAVNPHELISPRSNPPNPWSLSPE